MNMYNDSYPVVLDAHYLSIEYLEGSLASVTPSTSGPKTSS